ncbi:LysR family transcriptional regulator [Kosakonia sacchari]|uniref:DNA-binding transcriptional regulator, LysR family n=1 Tax=Kosakonia sacchari TaxID=1158459 RepID=A0A1G4Y5B7_9ENTR|nr:LysR family transcriptional regulator [Kosakonia sacchari]AHJ75394.1 LysR family transcriptional regulator [Kosakonia sacchari SP1]SCX48612.1 DNA-binding transcriptional regulator, LysR family [Kosakonia sacchari]
MVNLNRLDLNLLLTLDVLLREHNVTRAAQRLNLSQPSVSVQLARLREIFDDPLLLPGPRGMQPTVRADELREPLRQALEALERAVSPVSAFDPARASVTWRIAATDYTESAVLLPLLNTLRREAPASRLAVFELNPGQIKRQAEQGDIDLFFHLREGAPASLHQRLLFTERYVLAGRLGHPALKHRPSLKQFCQLEHVIVSPEGGGFQAATDDALAARGLTRNVVLSVPHFLFMLDVLARTDLVAVLPERLVANTGALQVVDPPLDLPGFDMLMLWHERLHRDPGHKWLRQQVLAVLGNADRTNTP